MGAESQGSVNLGYSPLQHAFGRTPQDNRSVAGQELHDLPILTEAGVSAEHGHNVEAMRIAETTFLEEQAKERLHRAVQAGHSKMKHFCPGDLVYAWSGGPRGWQQKLHFWALRRTISGPGH